MPRKSAKQNRKWEKLMALLRQSEERCAALEKKNRELRQKIQKIDRFTEQFLNAQCAQYGQFSEKKGYVMKEGEQLFLFNEAEAEQDPKAEY